MAAAKKLLMIIGDYVEDYEAMVPYQMLLMLGHSVTTVSPGKKAGETVRTAIHDFEGEQTYSEKTGHRFPVTGSFDDAAVDAYDGLILPGGRSPEFLRMDKQVLAIVSAFMEANKPVAAICHALQILVSAKLLEGRTCTAYSSVEDEVLLAGGNWVPPNATFTNAVVDGNLVSAPAWPAHPEWIAAFSKVLEG